MLYFCKISQKDCINLFTFHFFVHRKRKLNMHRLESVWKRLWTNWKKQCQRSTICRSNFSSRKLIMKKCKYYTCNLFCIKILLPCFVAWNAAFAVFLIWRYRTFIFTWFYWQYSGQKEIRSAVLPPCIQYYLTLASSCPLYCWLCSLTLFMYSKTHNFL